MQAERYNSAAALNYPALFGLLLTLPLASCLGNNGLKLATLQNDFMNGRQVIAAAVDQLCLIARPNQEDVVAFI